MGTKPHDSELAKGRSPKRDGTRAVLLLGYRLAFDHFAGVDRALRALGRDVRYELAQGGVVEDEVHTQPWIIRRAGVVAVPDDTNTINLAALRTARRAGVPTALMMDGLVEFSNTALNPACGPGFLRPAPVDLVCAAGPIDTAVLRALGNGRVAATGLPRVEAFRGSVEGGPGVVDPDGPLVIATANTPAFSDRALGRVERALTLLQRALTRRGISVRWRVGATLADRLGVERETGPLIESLRGSCGVIATPSTVTVEAMAVGLPVGLLNAHPLPLWSVAPWIWDAGVDESASDDERDAMIALLRGTAAAEEVRTAVFAGDDPVVARGMQEGSAGALIDAVRGGGRVALRARCLEATHRSDAAGCVAKELEKLALHGPRADSPAARLRIEVVPTAPPPPSPGVRQIVSVNLCDGSLVGGVATWSVRLGRGLRARPDLGYDARTLLVAMQPMGYARHGLEHLPDDDGTSVVSIDPSRDPIEAIAALRAAIEAFGPDVVLPNFGDLAWAASAQLRARGVRTVAVAHNDNGYFRDQIGLYSAWDAGVAVSATCERWMREISGDRPMHRITYGVPISAMPRRSGLASGVSDRLELAYIGRLTEDQKRVSDLVHLARGLVEREVRFTLHLVGDGPSGAALRSAFDSMDLRGGRVVFHGPRGMDWVEAFLPTLDVSVLVSDHEGTSISMLEAMGAGVVPCVTRVASGVDDWIRDGVNGITVPIGDPDGMAARLAAVYADPTSLDRMGGAAHATIAGQLSIERMAERYAAVLDEAFSRPAPSTDAPTALGLCLSDAFRWNRGSFEDPIGSDRAAGDALRDAGFRSVSFGRPRAGCDAVLVRSVDNRPSDEELYRWRAGGLGVAISPELKDDRTLARVVHRLREREVRATDRVAIYGCGVQSRVIAAIAECGFNLVGFLDDHAGPVEREDPEKLGARYLTLPVVRPAEAVSALGVGVVVLASWRFEPLMWWRGLNALANAGAKVVPAHRTVDELEGIADWWRATARGAFDRVWVDGPLSLATDTLRAIGIEDRLASERRPLGDLGKRGEAAGVQRRGQDSLGAGDLIVLTAPSREHGAFFELRAARLRGAGVLPTCFPIDELTAPERATDLVKNLRERGRDRVAVFGAGAQARRIAEAMHEPPVGFIDDRPASRSINGRPVVRPTDAWTALRPNAVVLSSKRWQGVMLEACAELMTRGAEVVSLYGSAAGSTPALTTHRPP